MAERSLPDEKTAVLLESEWTEIENCAMALHAAIACGVEDEGFELLRAVYLRLSKAVEVVRTRCETSG